MIDPLTPKQQEAFEALRQAGDAGAVIPATTGAKLVKLGMAWPKEKPEGADPIPRGYGFFKSK